ncbi:MAG: AEC family transporter [Syntrophomonadaceae bacterium]|jgi:predicted permease
MVNIIVVIIPIFLIIIMGNILKRTKWLDDAFLAQCNKLIFNIFLPVLIFDKISQSNFSEVFSIRHIGIMIASLVLLFVISFPLAKLLRLPQKMVGTFASSNYRPNLGYLGLPICYFTLGDEGLVAASVLLAFGIPVNNVLGVLAFTSGKSSRFSFVAFLRDSLYNPLVISCMAGILFAALKWHLPGIIVNALSIIGGVPLALALISIGATTNFNCLKGNVQVISVSVIMKLLVQPLTAYLMLLGFGLTSFSLLLDKVLILMLAAPCAQVNYIFASAMDGDTDLASGSIVATTLFSIITFSLWLHLLGTGNSAGF